MRLVLGGNWSLGITTCWLLGTGMVWFPKRITELLDKLWFPVMMTLWLAGKMIVWLFTGNVIILFPEFKFSPCKVTFWFWGTIIVWLEGSIIVVPLFPGITWILLSTDPFLLPSIMVVFPPWLWSFGWTIVVLPRDWFWGTIVITELLSFGFPLFTITVWSPGTTIVLFPTFTEVFSYLVLFPAITAVPVFEIELSISIHFPLNDLNPESHFVQLK